MSDSQFVRHLQRVASDSRTATYGQLVMLSRQRLHLHLISDKHNQMYVYTRGAD